MLIYFSSLDLKSSRAAKYCRYWFIKSLFFIFLVSPCHCFCFGASICQHKFHTEIAHEEFSTAFRSILSENDAIFNKTKVLSISTSWRIWCYDHNGRGRAYQESCSFEYHTLLDFFYWYFVPQFLSSLPCRSDLHPHIRRHRELTYYLMAFVRITSLTHDLWLCEMAKSKKKVREVKN